MIAGHSSLSSRSSRVHVESLPSGSAAESNCNSTRKKYKNKKFVSYGYSVGHFFLQFQCCFGHWIFPFALYLKEFYWFYTFSQSSYTIFLDP